MPKHHYDDHTIFDDIVYGRFEIAIRVRKEGGQWFILVPEIVQPKKDRVIVLRSGSVQLIALLESGDVDYAFEYESVSRGSTGSATCPCRTRSTWAWRRWQTGTIRWW